MSLNVRSKMERGCYDYSGSKNRHGECCLRSKKMGRRCLACSPRTTLSLEPWDLVRKRRRYSRQTTLLPYKRRLQCFKTRTIQQFPGRPWLSQGSV
ncbi:hypothetical protein Peur_030593 [Populus x canadensis]